MNKITRSQFLRLLPAAGLLLTACAEQAGPTVEVQLVPAGTAALDYAQQFTAAKYEGGYTLPTGHSSLWCRRGLPFRPMYRTA